MSNTKQNKQSNNQKLTKHHHYYHHHHHHHHHQHHGALYTTTTTTKNTNEHEVEDPKVEYIYIFIRMWIKCSRQQQQERRWRRVGEQSTVDYINIYIYILSRMTVCVCSGGRHSIYYTNIYKDIHYIYMHTQCCPNIYIYCLLSPDLTTWAIRTHIIHQQLFFVRLLLLLYIYKWQYNIYWSFVCEVLKRKIVWFINKSY